MEPVPTVGRIVHFKPPAPAGERMAACWKPGQIYPAVVSVAAAEGTDLVGLNVLGPDGMIFVPTVAPDANGDAGGWSWPPIVR